MVIAATEIQRSIKEDINFLEYPTWIVDEDTIVKTIVIKKKHGDYKISCYLGVPTRLDRVMLDFLLFRLMNTKAYTIKTTRYELACQLYPEVQNLGSKHYERVILSLRRWRRALADFNGVFYENYRHISRDFSFIDCTTLYHDTGELIIRMNTEFVDQQKASNYYKTLDINVFRSIKQPLAARLYEILTKNFERRTKWHTSLESLAEKLTITRRKGTDHYYTSDVLPKLKKALIEYNQKAPIKVEFSFDKTEKECFFVRAKKRARREQEQTV